MRKRKRRLSSSPGWRRSIRIWLRKTMLLIRTMRFALPSKIPLICITCFCQFQHAFLLQPSGLETDSEEYRSHNDTESDLEVEKGVVVIKDLETVQFSSLTHHIFAVFHSSELSIQSHLFLFSGSSSWGLMMAVCTNTSMQIKNNATVAECVCSLALFFLTGSFDGFPN